MKCVCPSAYMDLDMCAIGLPFRVGNLDFTLIHYLIYWTFKTLKLPYYVKALVSENFLGTTNIFHASYWNFTFYFYHVGETLKSECIDSSIRLKVKANWQML